MASVLTTHDPILVRRTISGNQAKTKSSIGETAGMTFVAGSPVQLNTSTGYIRAWPNGTSLSGNLIAGVSYIAGQNLSSNGAGLPPAFGSIGFPGTTTTYGTVPNQPNAVNILAGAPFSTGASIFAEANNDTLFVAQVDNSAGSGDSGGYTPGILNVGLTYPLNVDGAGNWYIDLSSVTTNVKCVVITSLVFDDLASGSTTTEFANGHLEFMFLPAAQQFSI
jgi:hypothetical protein